MATRIFFLALLFVQTGCISTQDWKGGVPRSGRGMPDDQRISEHAKYIISSINKDYVVTRDAEGKEAHFDVNTFSPVLNHLDPTMYPDILSTKKYVWIAAVTAGSGAVASARIAQMPEVSLKNPMVLKLGAFVGLMSLGTFYCGYVSSGISADVLKRYQLKLDQLLFPGGDLAMGLRLSW